MSEARDFLKENWAILESERIRKKRKRKAVTTVYGIIGAYVGGAIASFFGVILITPIHLMVKESTANIIEMTVFIISIVAGLVLGARLGVSEAKVNQFSSGKKILSVILIFGATAAIIAAISMIIGIANHKNQSTTVYKKTVISQANKSTIESTGNQNKKQQSKDNYEPKTSIPAPQAKLTKAMQKTPAFQIKHKRENYPNSKMYSTVDDAKVKFLDNDSLEIRIKVDRVTINCTWSSSDYAYVGTWRRDTLERGPVSKLLLDKRHDDRRMQGKIKLFPRFNSNNEIMCFYGYIMSYNAYIWQVGWSYGNDYQGTPIKIAPTFWCLCPDPEGD